MGDAQPLLAPLHDLSCWLKEERSRTTCVGCKEIVVFAIFQRRHDFFSIHSNSAFLLVSQILHTQDKDAWVVVLVFNEEMWQFCTCTLIGREARGTRAYVQLE